MKNLKETINKMAVEMIWHNEAGVTSKLNFIKKNLKKVLSAVYQDEELSIHADYINEKFTNWKTCDTDSLLHIARITE